MAVPTQNRSRILNRFDSIQDSDSYRSVSRVHAVMFCDHCNSESHVIGYKVCPNHCTVCKDARCRRNSKACPNRTGTRCSIGTKRPIVQTSSLKLSRSSFWQRRYDLPIFETVGSSQSSFIDEHPRRVELLRAFKVFFFGRGIQRTHRQLYRRHYRATTNVQV